MNTALKTGIHSVYNMERDEHCTQDRYTLCGTAAMRKTFKTKHKMLRSIMEESSFQRYVYVLCYVVCRVHGCMYTYT